MGADPLNLSVEEYTEPSEELSILLGYFRDTSVERRNRDRLWAQPPVYDRHLMQEVLLDLVIGTYKDDNESAMACHEVRETPHLDPHERIRVNLLTEGFYLLVYTDDRYPDEHGVHLLIDPNTETSTAISREKSAELERLCFVDETEYKGLEEDN